MRPGTEKLPALTSLRFFAAAAIVYFHYQGHFGIPEAPWLGLAQAVSFFFILSGFILTYTYPALPTWRDRCRFLILRAARLAPANAAALVITLILMDHIIADTPRDVLLGRVATNLLMIQSWSPSGQLFTSLNGPAWSISTEFAFYFAFPFLIAGLARTWVWKLGLCAALTASLIAFATWAGLPRSDLTWWTDVGRLLYESPASRLVEFMIGMCAALWIRPAVGAARATAWQIGALAAAGAYLLVSSHLNASMSTPLTWWLGVVSPPTVGVVLAFAMRRGLLARALSFAPLVLLGEISYSIYLLHQPIGYLFGVRGMDGPAFLPLVLGTLVLVSWTVFVVIERPARRAVRRMLDRAEGRDSASLIPAVPSAQAQAAQ